MWREGASARKLSRDPRPVQSLEADHDKFGAARLRRAARAGRNSCRGAGRHLARAGVPSAPSSATKPFRRKTSLSRMVSADAREEIFAILDHAKRDHEALEVVMVVLAFAFQFVMGRAVGDIALGLCFEADQDVGGKRALARRDDARAGSQFPLQLVA